MVWWVFAVYVAGLFVLAWKHRKVANTFDEYVTAGGSQGGAWIAFSLLASIIGGSATLGIVDMAGRMGFPAFWWLGVGALGLMVQGLFLSRKVRGLGARTLPDVAAMVVNEKARSICALIIAVTWTGIVAAQFAGLGQLITLLTGAEDTRLPMIAASLAVIAYTAAGGQISVLRTDALQFLLLGGALLLACGLLFSASPLDMGRFELLNEKFGPWELLRLALVVGGAYVVGPDIFSRNLAARNGGTARKAAFWAALGLLGFGLAITSLGLWADGRGFGSVLAALPGPVAALLVLGLISALLSSADTCLISTASILENDFLKKRSLGRVRVFVLVVGLISLGIALFRGDIIGLLVSAYSVYAPGIVGPLFIAILAHGRRELNSGLWLLAVTGGGICGFTGSMLGMENLPVAGMAFSTCVALMAVRRALPQGCAVTEGR